MSLAPSESSKGIGSYFWKKTYEALSQGICFDLLSAFSVLLYSCYGYKYDKCNYLILVHKNSNITMEASQAEVGTI